MPTLVSPISNYQLALSQQKMSPNQLQVSNQPFVIEGHANSLGSDSYNEALGLAQAEEVARFLVDHGVTRQQLVVRMEGESKPTIGSIITAHRSMIRQVDVSRNL